MKRILICGLISIFLVIPALPSPTWAEEAAPAEAPAPAQAAEPAAEDDEYLPEIEARSFPIKVAKRSRSKRVYLLDDINGAGTKPGKILLLKSEANRVMGLRVLRTYDDKRQVAAKRIRMYEDREALDVDQTFVAIEKIRDILPYEPTAEEQQQDEEDLKELEGGASGVQGFDPELDVGTSPVGEDYELEEDDQDLEALVVKEIFPFDTDTHWLSAEVGFFRNDSYFAGAGLRYGLNVGQMLFLDSSSAQDSIALEGGLFLFKVLDLTGANDAYTVAPLIGTVRYNVLFSEAFGIFVYSGISKSVVVTSSQPTDEGLERLTLTTPAAGAGMLFQIGPKWYARVDLGLEMFGVGLVVRF